MIITPELVLDAIKSKLEETFPGEPVYQNITNRDFVRPSDLVELHGIQMDPMASGNRIVDFKYQVKITTFSQVDEVHFSHLPVLDLRVMAILSAFAEGFLRVGDRAASVQTCKADTSMLDAAEVLLTLSLRMDRREFRPDDIIPLMEDLILKFPERSDNI